ncbi:alpha/beta fold hydrolase [Rhizobium sp. BE258]|uniref:alpha/beta fold hydrolase n=1 Tax=Rhizobium sp. BE258 TaxID=2817722 RepID=UPI000DD52C5A|nr:alpha/beta hydrolase [Rhizobium sp. BE258]MDR7144981.1 pimeloyl-ACP methyl ester carboxylesterase [Rhizobium sp. BE258]
MKNSNNLRIISLTALMFSTLCGITRAADIGYHTEEVAGLQVFYREAGPKDKLTIVLLHGFPSSSHMFRDLIPELTSEFHVIAPDYPGMGQSQAPAAGNNVTFDSESIAIEQLLDKLGVKKAIFYMQDFGGPIGMRIATRHPDMVEGLIFQNIAITEDGWDPARLKVVKSNKGPETPDKRAAAESRVSMKTDLTLYQHGAANASALNPDAWTNDAFAIANPESRRVMTDLQLDIASNLELYPAWARYLADQKPKTLVVWGDNDPIFTPHAADAIGALAPGSQVQHYNSGHFALEEVHSDVAARIINLFSGTKR